jgi:hypothetical protein
MGSRKTERELREEFLWIKIICKKEKSQENEKFTYTTMSVL